MLILNPSRYKREGTDGFAGVFHLLFRETILLFFLAKAVFAAEINKK